MTRALADMTPEEQQACEGMWAEWKYGAGQMTLVVIEEIHPVRDYAVCVVPRVRYVEPLRSALFPRHDLLRAWNPDGTPIKGEWVEGHMWWGEDTDTLETVDVVGAECLATGHIQGFDEWPDGVTPGEDVSVRRFITEWGATNE